MLLNDDVFEAIAGSTDSEHFAALYMTFLCEGSGKEAWMLTYDVLQMKNALMKAMTTLFELQVKRFGTKAPANSLNGKLFLGCWFKPQAIDCQMREVFLSLIRSTFQIRLQAELQ